MALLGPSSGISFHQVRSKGRGFVFKSFPASSWGRREVAPPVSPAKVEKLGLQSPVGEVAERKEELGRAEKVEKVEYDWREEWYPLYLAVEVPHDAPLGLSVFHKQLVLYKDGAGVFRCYEDRCPHRFHFSTSQPINLLISLSRPR